MAEQQGQFEIVGQLGKGSFGTVYRGWHNRLQDFVAVKVEQNSNFQLKNEFRILTHMKGNDGFPAVHWFGKIDESYVMVMQLLGASLEQMKHQRKKFSLPSISFVGSQLLDRLQKLHEAKLIHRDIKPENVLMGVGEKRDTVFLIDYGLCKGYTTRTGEHISMKSDKKLTGTARYTSVNTHLGIEQSRRDDLEITFYMFCYLLLGRLPWQSIRATQKLERYDQIKEKKVGFRSSPKFQSLPPQFQSLYAYIQGLQFEEEPNYAYLKELVESFSGPMYQSTPTLNRMNSANKPTEGLLGVQTVGQSDCSGETSRKNNLTASAHQPSGSNRLATGSSLYNQTGSTISLKETPLFNKEIKEKIRKIIGEQGDSERNYIKTIDESCCILF